MTDHPLSRRLRRVWVVLYWTGIAVLLLPFLPILLLAFLDFLDSPS